MSIADPEGRVIEYDYTDAGSLSEMHKYPASGVALTAYYAYTTNGLLSAVTNANNHWIHYDHDATAIFQKSPHSWDHQ